MPRKIDNSGLRTYSIYQRESKVRIDEFGKRFDPADSFEKFLESLPDILAAKDIRAVAAKIAEAKKAGRPFLLGIGAHVIKTGLSPLIIDFIEKGLIDGIAMNGACIIHDTEIAMVGHTSEDVAKEIQHGTFGMVRETTEFIINAVKASGDRGMGEAVGKALYESEYPHKEHSVLTAAYFREVPVTVHVAMGTDIINMHPGYDGAAFGRASHEDFLIFSGLVSRLDGGVYLNLGSSVILPEVFLKALSMARNLGHPVKGITTVNMDFIQHYRPSTNVVKRPTLEGGTGYSLTGHHEIMFPLLCAAVKYYLGR